MAGDFDFSHYKATHRFLFSDVYDWAGEIRTVNISKKGKSFSPSEEIDQMAKAIFARLKKEHFFTDLPHGEFVDKITDFHCVTNGLHPFREGNGRTQRAFLTQLIRSAGYEVNWAEVDGNLLMIATIHAGQDVRNPLRKVLSDAIDQLP